MLARSPDQLDWQEVWYRLDEGRGQVSLRGFDQRVNRTSNNSQAVQQARKLLEEAGAEEKGYLEYDEFKNYVSFFFLLRMFLNIVVRVVDVIVIINYFFSAIQLLYDHVCSTPSCLRGRGRGPS